MSIHVDKTIDRIQYTTEKLTLTDKAEYWAKKNN